MQVALATGGREFLVQVALAVDTCPLPTPPALETPSPMCAVLVLMHVLMSEDWSW